MLFWILLHRDVAQCLNQADSHAHHMPVKGNFKTSAHTTNAFFWNTHLTSLLVSGTFSRFSTLIWCPFLASIIDPRTCFCSSFPFDVLSELWILLLNVWCITLLDSNSPERMVFFFNLYFTRNIYFIYIKSQFKK